jgi:hypothetical protein
MLKRGPASVTRSEGKLSANLPGHARYLPEDHNGAGKERSEIGETHWILVGEAYVHGIMHGEGLLNQTRPLETIHII